MGFNVETYQITKKDSQASSGSGGVSQEVLNRLDALESNQNNILGDFYFDFGDDRFIDLYKSTIIKSGNGIIPRQYTNITISGIEKNDDSIDYDKSTGIKYYNNGVSLLNAYTLYGELYLSPLKITKGSVGMKISSKFTNKVTTGQSEIAALKAGMLWFTSGVDNLGRLWVFRTTQYYANDTLAYLDIYSPNMSLIKSITLNKSSLIGNTDNNYGLFFNASNMVFLEDNTCLLTVRTGMYSRTGIGRDFSWASSWDDNCRIDRIILFKDDGTFKALYSDSGYYFYNSGSYPYYQYGSSPNLITIKNKTAVFSGGTYAYRSAYQDFDGNMNRNICGIDLRNLNSIKISKALKLTFPNRADGSGVRWIGNSIIQSNMFTRNRYFYNFITSNKRIDTGDKIGDLWSFQCGLDAENGAFYSDNSEIAPNQKLLLDETENPIVIYSHPGFNGMYYNTNNNKLYIFGNGLNNIGTVNCYDIDWTSRIDGKLKVKRVLKKNIELKVSTWGAIKNNTTMNSTNNVATFQFTGYNSNPWEYMKIVDFKGAIHLFYFAPQADVTENLCLKYMCLDYELNILVDETILNKQNNAPDVSNRISHFEVEILNDELIILINKGNNEDFTVNSANAPNINSAKSVQFFKIGLVESSVKFYYLNENNNTWIEVQNNGTVLFDNHLDYVRIKAALIAGNYGASPKITSFTVQSWNNNGDELRWSEYYSNKIDCLQGDGKATFSTDQDAGDGVINWFITFDGGKNYSPIELDEEFAYAHLESVDCRLKAIMGIKDNSDKIPIIKSYTIKTKHVVFHTDLEDIQINLIKTNFKIDTYTNATKNGLLKMTIDTLCDDSNIDKSNSNYFYSISNGSVSGSYIQTIPENVTDNVKTVLLVVDEKLENGDTIDYYISIDGGVYFTKVIPNIKKQVTNVNSNKNSIVFKAVFNGKTTLSAWGLAWN